MLVGWFCGILPLRPRSRPGLVSRRQHRTPHMNRVASDGERSPSKTTSSPLLSISPYDRKTSHDVAFLGLPDTTHTRNRRHTTNHQHRHPLILSGYHRKCAVIVHMRTWIFRYHEFVRVRNREQKKVTKRSWSRNTESHMVCGYAVNGSRRGQTCDHGVNVST